MKPPYYYDHYERYVALDPAEVRTVLELGVHDGGSLLMWAEFFPQAQVFGVDLAPKGFAGDPSRIRVMQADQIDTEAIGGFLRAFDVDTLDLVIDDCSHLGAPTKTSFWYLFERFLRPGGYYVIEDWGTGYQEGWPDGAALAAPDTASEGDGVFSSHLHGIPGFIKQVIDQNSRTESIVVTGALVAVKKQTPENAEAIERAIRIWRETGSV